jgi:hypothetical protein
MNTKHKAAVEVFTSKQQQSFVMPVRKSLIARRVFGPIRDSETEIMYC